MHEITETMEEEKRHRQDRCRSWYRNVMSLSVDDITSTVDTLLLLDTLMLGFLIALLTQSSAGKSDFIEADAISFRTTLVENDIFETSVQIYSHYILVWGQVGCCCFFASIGFGVTTYLNLNLSRAREDDEIRDRFSRHFLPFILLGYVFFLIGLCAFFISLQNMFHVVFPTYCTNHLDQPINDTGALFSGPAGLEAVDGSIPADQLSLFNMVEVGPEDYERCLGYTLQQTYSSMFTLALMVGFPTILLVGFAFNLYIDCMHEEDTDTDGKRGSISDALISAHPRFKQYIVEFNAADIVPSQLQHLTFEHYMRIGVSVGDAMRMMDAFADGVDNIKCQLEEVQSKQVKASNTQNLIGGMMDAAHVATQAAESSSQAASAKALSAVDAVKGKERLKRSIGIVAGVMNLRKQAEGRKQAEDGKGLASSDALSPVPAASIAAAASASIEEASMDASASIEEVLMGSQPPSPDIDKHKVVDL